MIFSTTINGIPCQCAVTYYVPERPMRIRGPGYGDADPPEPEIFEYDILDRKGRYAPWLEKYVTPEVEDRLLEELKLSIQEENHGYYDHRF